MTQKQSRVIEEMYESMHDLHRAGALSSEKMQSYDALYKSYKTPVYTDEMVRSLRSRLNVTQAALAALLNTSASTVQKWENGAKKPSGPSSRLLDILDRKGISVFL